MKVLYTFVGCIVAALILWGVLSLLFLKHVDAGNTGILIQYGIGGKPVITSVPTNSYTWINPFGGQTLVEYPTAQQQLVLSSRSEEGELPGNSTISCLMAGGGTIHIGVTINWQVDVAHPEVLYLKKPGIPLTSSLNNDINTTIVYGFVRSDLLDACTHYTWQDILRDGTGPVKNDQLRSDVLAALTRDLSPDGILVNQISLNERTPDSEIQAVLDAHNQAQKSDYLKLQAQNEAQAAIAKAEGDAQAIEIINKQLAQSPAYIQYLIAKTWDGKLPQYLSTNGQSNPVLSALGAGK